MKILGISGSLDVNSINTKLLNNLVADLKEHEVTLLTRQDLQLPLYDRGIQDSVGFPESVSKSKELIRSADLIIICSPEYNSTYSGALKNLIDWCSRTVGTEQMCWSKKVYAIAATSPGALGGLRGLYALRTLLENLGSMVCPSLLAVQHGQEFDQKRASKFIEDAIQIAEKLRK